MNDHYRPAIEQEIDLLEYVASVWQSKYRLVAVSVLMACVTLGVTLVMPSKYSASALVAYNSYDKPGGVAPKDYRGSDTVGLLERDMVIDTSPANEQDRILVRLRSFDFLKIFIEKHDLLKIIYSKSWDETNKTWIKETPFIDMENFTTEIKQILQIKPKKNTIAGDMSWTTDGGFDIRSAVSLFNKEMLHIDPNEKTGLLSLTITTTDPDLSSNLVNSFVVDFKKYQREIVLNELAQRRKYLEDQLSRTQNLEFQRSIYRMLETQLSAEALINIRKNYPIEIIEPAVPPLVKSSPRRLLWSIIAFIATMFIGLMYIVGKEIWRKVSIELEKYDKQKRSVISKSLDEGHGQKGQSSPDPAEIDGWVDAET